MKKLFYTIFAVILTLSVAQNRAMDGQSAVETVQNSPSAALKRDAKRLGFWATCIGISAATAVPFLVAADATPRRAVVKEGVDLVLGSRGWKEVPYKDTWYESTAIHRVLGILTASSLGVCGLFGAALVADSARLVSKWLPKALYPWSALTKVERLKALGLSAGAAVSAGCVGLALYKSL